MEEEKPLQLNIPLKIPHLMNSDPNFYQKHRHVKRIKPISLVGSSKNSDEHGSESSTSNENTKPSPKIKMTEKRALRIIGRCIHNVVLQIRKSKDSQRRKILRELTETERNYVDSLGICYDVYYKPLDQSICEKNPLIDTKTIGELFGNIDKIHEVHKKSILSVLDELAPKLRNEFPEHEVYLKIASTFIEIIPKLQQVYKEYLASENSEAILKKLKKNKRFSRFLQEALFNPKSKCQEIEDLLILPTQRIAGYKLLFSRILKYFPVETYPQENETYKCMLDLIDKIGYSMNEEKTDSSTQSKLLNIVENVNKVPPFMCIMKGGRKLLSTQRLRFIDPNDGKLLKHVVIYIMNDILLLTNKDEKKLFSSSKYAYLDAVPITQIRFSAFPIETLSANTFTMKTDIHEYNFYVKSSHKRDKFINLVKDLKKEIVMQVKKQSEEGMEYMQNIFQKIYDFYTSNDIKPRTRNQAFESLL